MIDLHSHTNESDGSFSPAGLVAEAVSRKLEALAITDHDTFAGYDLAVPHARDAGLELICGIELSTKLRGKTVHLLGYFLHDAPAPEFRAWLTGMQHSRRDRNVRLAERLQSLGLAITLEEVERLGRSLTGRPHFAKLLVQKGYVSNIQDAFDQYLGEDAKGYVDRREPQLADAIRLILDAGGLPSVAHPVRLRRFGEFDPLAAEMREMGLRAIEIYHSEHPPERVVEYRSTARRYGLAYTGGSDFHGEVKPSIELGSGLNGNLKIPRSLLDDLRRV
ncbi:MAG: PHP domain-containing protein [Bryobacteraceae bacterium]